MGQAAGLGWRLQLLLIIAAACVLRGIFFVGFALGDDLGYVASADLVLNGHYPSLTLNQYAYRPLLNALFGLFGGGNVLADIAQAVDARSGE